MVLFPEGSALGFISDCRGADPPVYPETRAGQSHSGHRDPHLSRDSHGGGEQQAYSTGDRGDKPARMFCRPEGLDPETSHSATFSTGAKKGEAGWVPVVGSPVCRETRADPSDSFQRGILGDPPGSGGHAGLPPQAVTEMNGQPRLSCRPCCRPWGLVSHGSM